MQGKCLKQAISWPSDKADCVSVDDKWGHWAEQGADYEGADSIRHGTESVVRDGHTRGRYGYT